MLEIWLWLKFTCKEHKAAFSRRKIHILIFYINLKLGRVSRCRNRHMATCGRGWVHLQLVCVSTHQHLCTGSFMPPSFLGSTESVFRGTGVGEGQLEKETGIWFFQASRRYLISAGRLAVCNGDELRIAITQSKVWNMYFSLSFYTIFTRPLCRCSKQSPWLEPCGVGRFITEFFKKMKTVQLSSQVEGIISTWKKPDQKKTCCGEEKDPCSAQSCVTSSCSQNCSFLRWFLIPATDWLWERTVSLMSTLWALFVANPPVAEVQAWCRPTSLPPSTEGMSPGLESKPQLEHMGKPESQTASCHHNSRLPEKHQVKNTCL